MSQLPREQICNSNRFWYRTSKSAANSKHRLSLNSVNSDRRYSETLAANINAEGFECS
jgi:hypothetical protein